VRSIAEASQTGPATNIITGIAVGLECTAIPVLVISPRLSRSYHLGSASGVAHAGLFGTAVATMGMLGTAGLHPRNGHLRADHRQRRRHRRNEPAARKREAQNRPPRRRRQHDQGAHQGVCDRLRRARRVPLFSAYLDEVEHYGAKLEAVNIAKPEVFVGGLLGAMLVFLFSALAIRAVGKAAYYVINEVRRQFKENPGILKGTSKPDYGRCVDIVTVGALKEMVVPGILAVGMPIAVGVIFRYLFNIGAETVAAFLMVGTIAGILMATFLNNGGGAWDNAKKFIEMGHYGGKGSETHKAAVVGDTSAIRSKIRAGRACTC
jgi:K(+)-stimulated pyrophosphate-energized sodium pump